MLGCSRPQINVPLPRLPESRRVRYGRFPLGKSVPTLHENSAGRWLNGFPLAWDHANCRFFLCVCRRISPSLRTIHERSAMQKGGCLWETVRGRTELLRSQWPVARTAVSGRRLAVVDITEQRRPRSAKGRAFRATEAWRLVTANRQEPPPTRIQREKRRLDFDRLFDHRLRLSAISADRRLPAILGVDARNPSRLSPARCQNHVLCGMRSALTVGHRHWPKCESEASETGPPILINISRIK